MQQGKKKIRKGRKGQFILEEGTFYGIPFTVELHPKIPNLSFVRIKNSPLRKFKKNEKIQIIGAILNYLELEGFNDEQTEIH